MKSDELPGFCVFKRVIFLLTRGECTLLKGPKEDRLMTTGLHTVTDIYCNQCLQIVGWKYVSFVKFCLERFYTCWAQLSYSGALTRRRRRSRRVKSTRRGNSYLRGVLMQVSVDTP